MKADLDDMIHLVVNVNEINVFTRRRAVIPLSLWAMGLKQPVDTPC